MDTLVLGILQSIGSHVNILLYSTCQRTNSRPCHSLTDFYNRVKVTGTADRESCLDNINAKSLQLAGYLNFLHRVQLATGNLLTVAQCGVENKQSVTHFTSFV